MQDSAFDRTAEAFAQRLGREAKGFAFAPYRLSPLGAHTDHQGGPAMGFTLRQGIRAAFAPKEGQSLLHGELPTGTLSASDLEQSTRLLSAIEEALPPGPAIEVLLQGDLCPGGIASSAATGVALLLALLSVRGMPIDREGAAKLLQEAETRATRVPVGRLDPAIILAGDERSWILFDAKTGKTARHRLPRRLPPLAWLLVDAGELRRLSGSPYAERVAECALAARALGIPGEAPRLGEFSPEDFRRRRLQVPPALLPRAEHVFGEIKRVKQSLKVLADADAVALGRLINASGDSLQQFFGAGTPSTDAVVKRLRAMPGVYGASYAGAGFGGHVQAMCDPSAREDIARTLVLQADLNLREDSVQWLDSGPGAFIR